jgi:hypothetical protein
MVMLIGATVGATVGEKLKIGTVGAALGPPAALKNHIKAIETHLTKNKGGGAHTDPHPHTKRLRLRRGDQQT